mmetsp:Transcript_23522/g.54652  ORF Transcript_23522/g.54652 Transcript_23522/m.54652 type:complete len:335 (-) Transcript_23522:144-1148(-)
MVHVLCKTISLGCGRIWILFDQVESLDLTKCSQELQHLVFRQVIVQPTNENLVWTIRDSSTDDTKTTDIKFWKHGRLRSHGRIVIVWTLDLHLALSHDVDSIQGHTSCRHFNRFELQEAKTTFLVNVDTEYGIFVDLLDQCSLDGLSKKFVKAVFRHIHREIPNVESPGMTGLLRKVTGRIDTRKVSCRKVGHCSCLRVNRGLFSGRRNVPKRFSSQTISPAIFDPGTFFFPTIEENPGFVSSRTPPTTATSAPVSATARTSTVPPMVGGRWSATIIWRRRRWTTSPSRRRRSTPPVIWSRRGRTSSRDSWITNTAKGIWRLRSLPFIGSIRSS